MSDLSNLKKDVQDVIERQKRILDAISQLERKETSPAGKEQAEIHFPYIEAKAGAYPLANHKMSRAGKKQKENYLYLLFFTAKLLYPYAKHVEAGMICLERVRRVLAPNGSLRDFMMIAAGNNEIGSYIAEIKAADGKDAFLLDSLFMAKEMHVSTGGLKHLCQLYALMGCGENTIKEAIEAVQLIYHGDRTEFMTTQSGWTSFHSDAAACYLNLEGDLNIRGKQESREYYALWPERKPDVTGVPKYAPKVILVVNACEGEFVGKGDVLFTLYGTGRDMKRDFMVDDYLEDPTFPLDYAGIVPWEYIVHDCVRQKETCSNISDVRYKCEELQKHLDKNYMAVEVRTQMDGTVRWEKVVKDQPFNNIIECGRQAYNPYSFCYAQWILRDSYYDSHYYAKNKKLPNTPLTAGDTFLSEDLTPDAMQTMPLCRVERNR